MASRIIHLAIGQLLSERHDAGDRDRFLLGSVIPDAVPKERSHFFRFFGEGRKTYDLTGFRQRYEPQLEDGLYLGFYMHLIEDIVFRDYLYHTVGYVPSAEKLPQLHRDYSLINGYIIRKYGLHKAPDLPVGIGDELIVREMGIDAAAFISELCDDFSQPEEGEGVYFTRKTADSYIARAVSVCGRELSALSGRGEHIKEEDFSWRRHA